MSQCSGDVVVIDFKYNKTIAMMADEPSIFGPELPSEGLKVSQCLGFTT